MANVDKAYGLLPYDSAGQPITRATPYFVPASDATQLFVGDPVRVQGGANTVATGNNQQYVPGTLQIVAKASASSTSEITGTIVNWVHIDNGGSLIPTVFRPASVNAVAMVCDDPNITYRIQSSGVVTDGHIGLNTNLIFTNSGDETNGISGVEADASPTADATKQLYIQGITPDSGNELGANAQLIVRINIPFPTFNQTLD